MVSTQDAQVILNPQTRALRERVAPLLTLYRSQITSNLAAGRAPSYVVDALLESVAAFDRWALDEAILLARPVESAHGG